MIGNVLGDITGTNAQIKSQGRAADLQAASAQAGIDETKRQFDVTQGNFAPYLDAGTDALGGIMDLLGLGEGGAAAQGASIEALKSSPLFQSLFGTGEEAILQNAAATGALRGGNTQRSLADFGSDTLAKVIQDRLSQLTGVAAGGQSSAASVGGFGQNASSSIADLLGQQGAARAGGILAKGNQQSAGIQSGLKLASSIAGFF
ncbi:hypothetical protein WP12_12320 [Sphingomonas sp. SRS2]|nr:hypothetical protein WP12_12320 [Sphingomonas sp. SRS2]